MAAPGAIDAVESVKGRGSSPPLALRTAGVGAAGTMASAIDAPRLGTPLAIDLVARPSSRPASRLAKADGVSRSVTGAGGGGGTGARSSCSATVAGAARERPRLDASRDSRGRGLVVVRGSTRLDPATTAGVGRASGTAEGATGFSETEAGGAPEAAEACGAGRDTAGGVMIPELSGPRFSTATKPKRAHAATARAPADCQDQCHAKRGLRAVSASTSSRAALIWPSSLAGGVTSGNCPRAVTANWKSARSRAQSSQASRCSWKR